MVQLLTAGFTYVEAENLTIDDVYMYSDAIAYSKALEDLDRQESEVIFAPMMESKDRRKLLRQIARSREQLRRKHHAIRPYDIDVTSHRRS